MCVDLQCDVCQELRTLVTSLAEKVKAQDAVISAFKKSAELAGTKAVTASKACGQLAGISEKMGLRVDELFKRLDLTDEKVYSILDALADEESEEERVAAAAQPPKREVPAKKMPRPENKRDDSDNDGGSGTPAAAAGR